MTPSPDLNRAELREAVLEAGRRVSQAAVIYHSKVAERFGLGATDMKALDLIQSEGPMSPSDLASRMGFARPSVTAIIDRLEAKNLVRREAHPDDGRRLLIEFDPAAIDTLAPVYGPWFDSLNDMLDDYTTDELAVIARSFNDIAARQKVAADQLGAYPSRGDNRSLR